MAFVENLKAISAEEIDNKAKSLHELSQKIWNNPELGFEEKFAHKTLTDFLESEGFCVERHKPLETSFVARFGTSDGPQIGIMCEYDALPGIGHACGHNLIAEAGVAAALGIKAALEKGTEVTAKVIVYGTPAEEGGGGKVYMIEEGSFNESDICMIVHPLLCDCELEDNEVIAIQEIEILYSGKASHASAAPWEGLNALDAAVACYNDISMMRQQMKPNCRVHGVITNGGEKPNVVPKEAALCYFVRAPTDRERDELTKRVISCAKGAATATGCECNVKPIGKPFSNLRSNITLRSLYIENLKKTGYKSHFIPGRSMLGSTDVGNVSYFRPTIHPYYSIPALDDCHTEEFARAAGSEAAQLPTLQTAKAMAMAAIDIICNPAYLSEIQSEFEEWQQQSAT